MGRGHAVERAGEDRLNELFFAISDPSRRKILDLLRETGELSVTDLAQAFQMSLNGVSKHVKILERAHVVKRRVEWRTHYISPDWDQLRVGFEYLSTYHHFWNQRLDAFVQELTKKGDRDE